MRETPRSVNPRRFLEVVPMARPPTYWAIRPESIPTRLRRAADYYAEIANHAKSSGLPTAPLWAELAGIIDRAALEAERLTEAPGKTA